jgi:hypothetical protein
MSVYSRYRVLLTSKKGISALQIQRHMDFGSYEAAHSMCHKIRAALIEPETKLGGIVEVDETFVGGKAENRHWYKRDGRPGSTASGKAIVAGVVGSFHNVSKKYMPLRVAEFQFRYNNRFNDDIFEEAISGC